MDKGSTAVASAVVGVAILVVAVLAVYALSYGERASVKAVAYVEMINEKPYVSVFNDMCIVEVNGIKAELKIGESRCINAVCVKCQGDKAIVYRARLIGVS